MGFYLNPGNSGFTLIREDSYIDKTGMIALINEVINTPRKLTCISRPRRFGKSYAAKMLCAYYDKTCDSSELFADLSISQDATYEKYRNQFDVIYVDMSNILGNAGKSEFISFIEENVLAELKKAYPDVEQGGTFDGTLIRTAEYIGNKFIMIIDEWDAPIREKPEKEREYLLFLRTL